MRFDTLLIYVLSYFGLLTGIFFLLTLLENRHKLKSPVTNHFPKVTVIVPAYNEEKTIEKTVSSLLELDYPKEQLEVIVVDDGSTDGTHAAAKRFGERIKLLRKKNGGKGTALNLGLKHATGEFIAALDADSFVEPAALRRLIGYFKDPQVMAVTPSLRVHEPRNILQKIQMIEYMIGIFLRKIFAFLGSIHVTPGPFSIYRKAFFEKHGGYDEHNITEDIEIALRIQANHYKIENAADANVYTVSPSSFKALYKQRLRWYTGFLQNVRRYRHLVSPIHGNLGVIILPAAFISSFLVIVALFYATYKVISTAVKNYIQYNAINFDWLTLFRINTDPFFFNLNSAFFLGIISLVIGLCIILISKHLAQEKQKIKIPYLWYLLVYWLLFGFWWSMAVAYRLVGRRVHWRHKT